MPSMPDPASATAIGTPRTSATTSTRRGRATIGDLDGYAGGASSLNRYDRPLRMRVKSIQHENGQREEAQGDEAVGRSNQERKRAQRGFVAQPAQRLLAGGDEADHTEQ